MTLLWMMLAAMVASAVNAFAGGGTFLTFPALTGVARLSEKVANMTSTIGIWPGSAASVVAARRDYSRIPRSILVSYAIISVIGGTAGSVLLLVTSVQTFRLVVPWLLLAATAIFACAKPIARWAGRKHGDRSLKWTVLVGMIQLLIAIYGGYFGAGIGVLMLAGLSFAGLDDLRQTNALKVLLGTIINGLASLVFLFAPARFGGVDWSYALAMAAAAAVGGFVGMGLARKVPQGVLRAVILLIAALLTIIYFCKAYA